jgi:hypothetical protein
MTTPRPSRLEAVLKDRQNLLDAMDFARLNIRTLSEACGDIRHRSTIAHLHSGQRNTCSTALAGRIEHVLRLPAYNLFNLRVTTTSDVVTSPKRRANA